MKFTTVEHITSYIGVCMLLIGESESAYKTFILALLIEVLANQHEPSQDGG